MRNSRQKNIIRQAVTNRYDHPTAVMIYETARMSDPNISLGTVYRNLNQMVSRGELIKIDSPDGADRFDWQTFPHSHFFCKVCSSVADIEIAPSARQIRSIEKHYGCHLQSIQLIGVGYCQKCNKNKEELCQN